MLCSALLLLATASAHCALAAPGLLLQVSGPSAVHNVDNFKIITTVTNIGDESLKLLNDPHSPLSDLPTDLFDIVNVNGTSPDFIGIEALYALTIDDFQVKYVPHLAATMSDPLVFTRLVPGQSVEVEHDLSLAYDFAASGPGSYVVNVKSLNTFYRVFGSGSHVSALLAQSGLPTHAVNVTGSLIPNKRMLRPDTEDCEDWQTRGVHGAIPIAEKYIANALAELSREGSQGDNYKRWFGAPSEHRLSTVISHFEALTGNNFSEFTFICNTPYCARTPGVYAYVYPNDFGKVHVCDQFFRSPVGGTDSRASTIVHESSHFTRNGGTEDHAYGTTLTQDLARNYPQLAVMNADNHEYFSVHAKADGFGEAPVLLAQTYFAK
ncbi:Metalloprotease [Trametes coccinea BRFM310]|uniref:Metalloprotease n=1 Tax=Trametes coccinea (strain BRFM310) TaxID=1353009 RepID=A0A1Y2J2X2_TRAC3|nr:Metalloprotease [Trametes coccinea BRFM310]